MSKQEGRINHVMSLGVNLDAINIHAFWDPFGNRKDRY